MSDQPKPATSGCRDYYDGHPDYPRDSHPDKPTGEWTANTVAMLVAKGGVDMIADAHNAALAAAAERELHSYEVAKTCRDELAAEREHIAALQAALGRATDATGISFDASPAALAADRGWKALYADRVKECNDLHQQLAAEREKRKEMVEIGESLIRGLMTAIEKMNQPK